MTNPTLPRRSSITLASLRDEGFRPFFLFGALHAALMIALWIPWFLGFLHVPTAFTPIVWHQHELLFGYVPAIIAGFLLTAMPNWTKRKIVSGTPLILLVLLWLAGRFAVIASEDIGMPLASAIAFAFLPVLTLFALHELTAAGNRRNYKIVAVLGVFVGAQALFLYEFHRFGRIEIADRLAISTIVLLIGIVGGRVIPVFTGNWLRNNNPGSEPTPFAKLDLAAMLLSVLALAAWPTAALSESLHAPAGILMIAAGIFQLIRQARWCPHRTFREPLVTILHVAFLFVPLGFLLTGTALLTEDTGFRSAGIHAWTSGAIGSMTLAIMTRATRGHSGQALHAPLSTVLFIYAPIVLAAYLRIATALLPEYTMSMLPLAALFWVVAFLGYAFLYGPLVLRRRIP